MGKVASAQLHHGNVQGDLFRCFNQTICCELFFSSCPLQGGSLVSSTVHTP